VSALLLSGRVGDATDVAQGMCDQAADLPGTARLLGAAVSGRAALGAGRLDTACSLLGQAAEGLSASGYAIGWGFRYHVPYATALAMQGSTSEATETLAVLDKLGRPFRSLDYERSLAHAWCAAGQGAASEAIAIVLAAAERARADGQFAAEVICLQTATQFGYRAGGPRLRELERIVEGPRVGLAAQFAEALRDGNGAELERVSRDFELMGDLIAAADTTAHAAIRYRRHQLRGSALKCSTRAEALTQQCGGASTPALRHGRERLPLTDREYEIAMLIADGLSSPAVAERLTLSVRTVESHIYRAMSKTGTASREELAALIRRGRR
jgi:DNA-binding CsgD family transcriptional regulator